MELARHTHYDTFEAALQPDELRICNRVRHLIFEHFPELREKFGYGVPYYWGHSRICYLYPASFPYSGFREGVAWGFARGHLLSNAQNMLEFGARKQVGVALLLPGKLYPEDDMLELLHEAVLLDTELKRKR